MWKRASASRKAANSPTGALRGGGRLAQRAALGFLRALGGERGGLPRDRAPPVGQLAQLAARGRLSREHERRRRIVAHERAAVAPAARLDEPCVAQDLQAPGAASSARRELRGELELARQPLAGREHAGSDGLTEPPDDLLDGSLRLQRCERETFSRGHGPGHLDTITSR